MTDHAGLGPSRAAPPPRAQGSQPVLSSYDRSALPRAESLLAPSLRRRFALRGLSIALGLIVLATALALLLTALLFGA